MEKHELFTIGDMAKMFHLSVGSLHHYEKIGLLQPEYINQETGYRYYSTRQFECLNTIRYLRLLDMPLSQIADFLHNREIGKIREMLRQQKETVIRKQRDLQIIQKKIDNRLQQLEDAVTSELDTIQIIQTGPQRMAIAPYSELDISIRQLEKQQKDTVVFLGKVGVGISQKHLLEKQYDHYDIVFLRLDKEDAYQGTVLETPCETCVSVRFCGSHPEAPSYYRKLHDFILARKLTITGFSREITLIDYGLTNDTSQFVTEIQIPVTSE